MTEELKKIMEHAQEIAARENCFLYDLEMTGTGNGRILRVFIDKEGQEGVSIDDCSKVSRGLDLVLDVEDLIPGGRYQLEVSSPGLERQLRETWHYQKAVGELVNLQLNVGLGEIISNVGQKNEKRKKLMGKIVATNEDGVEVQMDTENPDAEVVKVAYNFIHKAKVVFPFENSFSSKKPKARKG